MSNLAGIYYNDTAAAPGICVSVYLSGCPLQCKGCQNLEAQNPNYGVPLTDEKIEEIVSAIFLNNVYRKLCILGGEPLATYNLKATYTIISKCLEVYPELEIFVWTGYTYEQLKERIKRGINDEPELINGILNSIEGLIDGPFVLEKRDTTLKMRGSDNQRIIDMPATLKGDKIVLLYDEDN